jgi:hypothetical protein
MDATRSRRSVAITFAALLAEALLLEENLGLLFIANFLRLGFISVIFLQNAPFDLS